MPIWIVAGQELRDGVRRGWVPLMILSYALLCAGAALAAVAVDPYAAGAEGMVTGLVNLTLLVIPLFGLTAGALSLAGDRERGTLAALMAQPVSAAQAFLGKFLGQAAALLAAVLTGQGLAALIGVAPAGGSLLAMAVMATLLMLASLGTGFLVAALVPRLVSALSAAMGLWLAVVLIGDLGLMGMAATLRLGIRALFFVSLFNPLHLYRTAALALVQPSLDLLGPVGAYASTVLGGLLVPVFITLLFVWAVVPITAGYRFFTRLEP